MHIVVFGASGPTGRQVVRQALAAGHEVTAVTRRPDDYPLRAAGLTVAAADVTHAEQVSHVMGGADAVISTYGVPYSRKRVTVFSDGIANIVAAMRTHSVDRLVCVSSTSVAPGETPGESLFWRKILIPVLRNTVGRTLYDDMQRMEATVEHSGLDWTIVRPGGLFDTAEPTEDYEVSEGRISGRMTSRADLASTLLRAATKPQHSRSTIEVITRSQLPSLRTFRREAFGTGA